MFPTINTFVLHVLALNLSLISQHIKYSPIQKMNYRDLVHFKLL